MDTTVLSNTPFPAANPAPVEGAIGKVVAGAHDALDKATLAAHDAVGKAKPVIGRVAAGAHQAVDKAASVAVPTVEWLSAQSQSLQDTQAKLVADARQTRRMPRRHIRARAVRSVSHAAVGVVSPL